MRSTNLNNSDNEVSRNIHLFWSAHSNTLQDTDTVVSYTGTASSKRSWNAKFNRQNTMQLPFYLNAVI